MVSIQEGGERLQEGPGAFFSLGHRVVVIKKHTLFGENEARRGIFAAELDRGDGHRDPILVGVHLVCVDNATATPSSSTLPWPLTASAWGSAVSWWREDSRRPT